MQQSELNTQLHWLAARYANRPDVVQGAGGNLSVKLDDDIMLIKASGKEFADVGAHGENLVAVSYGGLKSCLSGDAPPDESAAAQSYTLQSSADTKKLRPSMELWFHALLSRFVLHTHSVYVNILACSYEGPALFEALARRIGISASLFPYYNPGFELGQVMARQQSTGAPFQAIFLENHGIIISGNSAKEVADMHDRIEREIRSLLSITESMPQDGDLDPQQAVAFNTLVLFPVQVVYPTLPHIRLAHRFILEQIAKSGFRVKTISNEHVSAIAGMEAEKYRKRMREEL